MMPRRSTPAKNVKLGADTVAEIRATFPSYTLDAAVKELLRVAARWREGVKGWRSGVPPETSQELGE